MENNELVFISIGAVVILAIGLLFFLSKRKKADFKDETKAADKQIDVAPVEELPLKDLTAKERELAPVLSDSAQKTSAEEVEKSVGLPPPEPEQLKTLKDALHATKSSLWGRIQQTFSGKETLNDDDIESLEEILYTSDLGPKTVQTLVTAVSKRLSDDEKSNLTDLRAAIKGEMNSLFEAFSEERDIASYFKAGVKAHQPFVLMMVGVNGVGKTTTIGKLAGHIGEMGLKCLVVAGDTFRAAAESQLKVWSERANVEIFSPEGVKDPSAVTFDGLKKAKAQGFDVVIIDTAGRLHTQTNLMEELKKMKRVMGKVIEGVPHEVLLVLDANSGQNALVQAHSFHEALDLSGVVLTKLDGSAKGGVAVGVACELSLPIYWIGVGEGIKDLRPFDGHEFVDSII